MLRQSTVVLVVGFIVFCSSCGEEVKPRGDEVEVSPGKFLSLNRRDTSVDMGMDESTELKFEWNGRPVTWKGVTIPVCLREHQGILYMVGYDRETDRDKERFCYYKQAGDGFEKMQPTNFPKEIATQNMWFSNATRYSRVGLEGTIVDEVQLARDLDPDALTFHMSLTAKIWYQLMTGKELYEMPKPLDKDVLREYVAKYKPVKLTAIVREPKGASEPSAQSSDARNQATVPAEGVHRP